MSGATSGNERDADPIATLAIGGKERRSMKKPTVKYSKREIGRVRIVEDFLPSPDKLALREDTVKVTLSPVAALGDIFQTRRA
jgi:hypothetical protein